MPTPGLNSYNSLNLISQECYKDNGWFREQWINDSIQKGLFRIWDGESPMLFSDSQKDIQ